MSIDDLLNPGYGSSSQLNQGQPRRLRAGSVSRPPREAREERTPLVTSPYSRARLHSGVPFSRRKVAISNPVSYLMEAMSTDLKACGESFVPDERGGQTLVLLGRSVPIRIDEALDHEIMAFMEAQSNEAYIRGVGLPGLAWARAGPIMVKLSELDRDGFFTDGGPRLAEASQLFYSALITPLFDLADGKTRARGHERLMGVIVIYFPRPEVHLAPLMTYARAVAASAPMMSRLMVHRARFMEGRVHRARRNIRIMRIAIKFLMPMLVRYYKNTGRKIVENIRTESLESGPVVISSPSGAAFRRPLHQFGMKPSLRPKPLLPQGVAEVLASREAQSRPARGPKEQIKTFIAKLRGGVVAMKPAAKPFDAMLSWVGAFAAIGLTESLLNILDCIVVWRGQGHLFALSGSFGALSTLMYALPDAPLAQPRVIFPSHALAILVSMVVMNLFRAGEMVMLQNALAVATVICIMALTRIVHPPAGALCLVVLGAYNHGATHEKMEVLFISVLLGLLVHLAVGLIVVNFSPGRAYPAFW